VAHDIFFSELNELGTLEAQKPLLKEYLQAQLKQYQSAPSQGEEIAYDIAGLMALDTVVAAAEDDSYVEALNMAGELELPPPHRSEDATWEALAKIINSL
jgi:hypothetical protein